MSTSGAPGRSPRPGPVRLGAASATAVVSVLLDVVAGIDLRHVPALAAADTPGHDAAHLTLVLTYALVVLATVLVVAVADVVLLGCAAAVVRLARLLRGLAAEVLGRPVTRRFRATSSTVAHLRDWSAYAARRGPPGPSTC